MSGQGTRLALEDWGTLVQKGAGESGGPDFREARPVGGSMEKSKLS